MKVEQRLCLGFLTVVVMTSGLISSVTLGAVPQSERDALIALYQSTNGDQWLQRDNWLKPGQPSQFNDPGTENTWYGITCNNTNTHVIGIDLSYNKLTGTLPAQVGNFPELIWLAFGYWFDTANSNRIGGAVPSSISQLTNLDELDLRWNRFTELPATIGQLPKLTILALSGNTTLPPGPLPEWVRNLPTLTTLYFDTDNLTGNIPSWIGELPNLQYLNLGTNQLSGSIPAQLGQLADLRILVLSWNQLSGEIPTGLGSLTKLTSLYLQRNKLSGPFPSTLANLTQLQYFWASDNQLNGSLPAWLGNWHALTDLKLNTNQFSGSLPPEMGQMTRLEYLDLFENQLSGSIPKEWANLSNLIILSLFSNNISGEIPKEVGAMPNLEMLFLSFNHLTGSIPKELGQMPVVNILDLIGNGLSGEIPAELANLTTLYYGDGLALHYNALYTTDPAMKAFIAARSTSYSYLGDWEATQTIAPSGINVSGSGPGGMTLHWAPIDYVQDEGWYEIWHSLSSSGPFTLREATANKLTAQYTGSLKAGVTNYFQIRTITDPHILGPGGAVSDFSTPLAVTPTGTIAGAVTIYADSSRQGDVWLDSPSQVLPAAAMTFWIDPSAFAGASAGAPMMIKVALPGGARLSQTLATGGILTAAPKTALSELVPDLAVVEYTLDDSGRPQPVTGGVLSGIGPHAVQLLRYVAGENTIVIRLSESTAGWTPRNGGLFLGFTIGLAGGSWPATDASNWGASGRGTQKPTLLCADLGRFTFDPIRKDFTVSVYAETQTKGSPAPVIFVPESITLFTVQNLLQGEIPVGYALGTVIRGCVVADVTGDGIEDMVMIAEGEKRVYWSPGSTSGGFFGIQWKELSPAGGYPVTLNVSDVTGAGRPDVVIGDDAGTVSVYQWTDVFGKAGAAAKQLQPRLRVALAGTPSAAVVADINNDGLNDYLYCDPAGTAMHVLFGRDFHTGANFSTGANPVSLGVGDFDGDGRPDVVVANRDSNSLSVFWNNGSGNFERLDLANAGAAPVAVASGDMNRDGRSDFVWATAGQKAMRVLLGQQSRVLNPADAQVISFDPHTPSAVEVDNFDGEYGADALIGFSDYNRLALCVADTAGHLTHQYNIDTLGDVVADPSGAGAVLGADRVVSVALGTSVGGIISRQGAAVVGQRGVNVAHLPRGKDVSFSLVNLENQPALLNFELYDDVSGKPLAASTQSLASGAQYARYPKEVLGSAADQLGRWVRVFATRPGVHGLWLVNDPGLTYLDGFKLPEAGDMLTAMVFTEVRASAGKTTTIILINPGREGASVTVTARGADGSVKGTKTLYLSGRSRKELNAGTEFPGLGDTGSVAVNSDRGLLGMALVADGGEVSSLNAMPVGGAAGGVLYSPHVAIGNIGGVVFLSELSVVNTSAVTVYADITLYRDNGTVVQTLANQGIPAQGKLFADIGQLLGVSGPLAGYLGVDLKGATGVVGNVTFGGTGGKRFLSSLPLLQGGHQQYLLGHIAIGTISAIDFFTGMAVLSLENGASTRVQVTAYDATGRQLDSRFLVLKPPDADCPDCGLRRVFMLGDLMPELGNIFGGYLVVESLTPGSGILVFELFGDNGLHFLSAVPAVPLS